MKTTERFDNAVSKLYTAYHENKLNAFDSCGCAVGNLMNNKGTWIQTRKAGCLGVVAPDIEIYKNFVKEIETVSGYSHQEILNVEKLFMINAVGNYGVAFHKQTKETQFKGLCAVVEYLCELDNIPNVMDYTKLFESENDKPKYQLNN